MVLFKAEGKPTLSLLLLRKGKALIERLRAKQMYEEDEDFPKDEEDIRQIHSIVLLALEKNLAIS